MKTVCTGEYYNRLNGMEYCPHINECAKYMPRDEAFDKNIEDKVLILRHAYIRDFRRCKPKKKSSAMTDIKPMEDKDINKKDVYADFLKTILDHISDEVDEYVEMINQAYELGKRDARLEHETTMPPNEDINKAAREIPQSEHDACNYANGILSKVRDEDFTLFPKSIIWAVAHDAYLTRQSEIDGLREALGDLKAAVESYDEQDEISIRLYEFVLDKATQLLKRYENKINNT